MYETAAKALLIAQIALTVGAAIFGIWAAVLSADGIHTYIMARPALETIQPKTPKRVMTAPL